MRKDDVVPGRSHHTFDLSAYVGAATRAFDVARTSYYLVLVTCGLVFLFLIGVYPYKSFPSELDYLNAQKSELDTLNGEQRALTSLQERTGEGALEEPIQEYEHEKRQLLADLHCTLTEGDDDCSEATVAELETDALTEEEIIAVADRRRSQLQAIGTGFRVPVLDQVIAPTFVPLVCSILLAVMLVILRMTVRNWRGSLELLLPDARSAGVLPSAYRLVAINSLSARAVSTSAMLRRTHDSIVVALHLVPALLVVILLLRHRHVFQFGPSWNRQISVPTVIGHVLGLVVIVWAGLASAINVVSVRRTLQGIRAEIDMP